MKQINLLFALIGLLICSAAANAARSGDPIISFKSDAYYEVGSANQFSMLIGVDTPGEYTIQDANGTRSITLTQALIENGEWAGSWFSVKVGADGNVKIWGDAAKVNTLVIDGGYLTEINMDACSNLGILSLEHNKLQKLDLTDFTRLMAIYLTDNPFTAATPLKVGAPKPDLQILEIDIIEHLDQSFNLSDYPALRTFDGYANYDLWNLDPTGCPELLVLSCEMSNVSSLDVTKNKKLLRLNISETRITEIDLSQNEALEHFIGGHDSGSINVGYRLKNLDLTHNPNLTILHANGNNLGSIDLTKNPKLTNVSLNRNGLKSLDISNCPDMASLYVMFNDMDFATLPAPGEIGEYFYRQNPMIVPRAIGVNQTLDLSSRVLREGTQTVAAVWRQKFGQDPTLLDESLYSYADGKISFNTAMTDSVYVEFANSLFNEYTLTTRPFVVKSTEDLGKPSKIAYFTGDQGSEISFTVGIAGATAETPKTFFVDFGNGELKEFKAQSAIENAGANVTGTPTGQVAIYIPEGDVLTSLYLNDIKLYSINVTGATEVSHLQLHNCGLYTLDLKYNRCLQWLDISGNSLYSLDLQGIYGDYEKNVLQYLDASGNQISSFNNMAPYAMKHLNLSNNNLESIVLKDYDNLEFLNLSNNALSENFDMTYLYSARDVNVANNNFITLTPNAENKPEVLNISNNNFTFSTLPSPSDYGTGYLYAPQRQILLPAKSPVVDLSSQAVNMEGFTTTFVWKKASGEILTAGSDYTCTNGLTRFLNTTLGSVYCQMTNGAFPQLEGELALRTSETEVVKNPDYKVASFLTAASNGKPEIIMASTEPQQVYVDWDGTGNLTGYDLTTQASSFEAPIRAGKTATVYTFTQAEAKNINVFSLYDIKLKNVDLTGLTGAYCLALGNAGLTAEDITMPTAPGLGELNLTGNNFSEYPYGDTFPNVSYLILSNNKFTEFDASTLPSLMNLVLSNNQITSVKFNNPNIWNLQLDNNKLETVDLNGLSGIRQLFLTSNLLHEIDLDPVKSTLYALSLVENRFDYSTLPLQDSYPQLSVYYYGNQAPMDVECVDMKVDLSSQAMINGNATNYTWYLGVPQYNEETEEIEGDALIEGEDYTIENGITTFLHGQPGNVICLMSNVTFPNLQLITNLLKVSGIDSITSETEQTVHVFNLQGILVGSGERESVLKALAPGLYIVNGKKIIIK